MPYNRAMDAPLTIGVGAGIALGLFIATRMQVKKNKVMSPAIEAALRAQGALTLPALTEALGLRGSRRAAR